MRWSLTPILNRLSWEQARVTSSKNDEKVVGEILVRLGSLIGAISKVSGVSVQVSAYK
jgi:hypothetical protein